MRLCGCPNMGPQQQTRYCRFAAVGPAGRRYQSIAAAVVCGGRMRAVPSCQRIIIIIIHEYYYGGAVALLLQDHLTMSVSRFAG